MRIALLALSLTAFTGGCYFARSPSRPLAALEVRRAETTRERCLMVMIPGFLDGPDTFLEHHFPDAVLTTDARCDMVLLDLHFRYYSQVGVADIVNEDILVPAAARGYDEIWVVGISMGGLGALLTAERYTDQIDGIILLAPFVGEENVLREIQTAGGAAAWRPPSDLETTPWTQANYTTHLWAWLRSYHTDPDAMPPLYIGWGDADRLGTGDALLGDLVGEGHVFTIPGRHAWVTWRPLFDLILAEAEPGRAFTTL